MKLGRQPKRTKKKKQERRNKTEKSKGDKGEGFEVTNFLQFLQNDEVEANIFKFICEVAKIVNHVVALYTGSA
jgi:hypothetical protein